jgi:glycosyltransferase involved in cell wall biosynthesis
VVDDNSEDNLHDLIKGYDVKYEKVNFRNAAAARNHAIDMVTGDYIAFLDADDIWYPNHLSRALSIFEEFPDSVGYINYFDLVDLNGKTLERNCPWDFQSEYALLTDCEYAAFYSKFKYFVGMSACIVEVNRFKEIGGFDTDFQKRHDIEMWWRLIQGNSCVVDKQKSSAYRKNVPGSVSQKSHLTEYFKLKGLLKNAGAYSSCKNFNRNVEIASISAMNQALLSGDASLIQEIRSMSKNVWGFKEKCLFNTLGKIPFAYRLLYSSLK